MNEAEETNKHKDTHTHTKVETKLMKKKVNKKGKACTYTAYKETEKTCTYVEY